MVKMYIHIHIYALTMVSFLNTYFETKCFGYVSLSVFLRLREYGSVWTVDFVLNVEVFTLFS